ncbi:NUDIX domain-containing protein [Bdellovibrio svalbardensis]|uniref:NUDIX hydrolase n=1 Tax=Bdellovibrio svalbardensis TaxID=2972972 RepID=A0ABT6DGA9_9BACT|nr:NUDIX hydrolase [Bdellovibrio svalbardensis]MDG0815856.1 NUDIX hydrolase [Bdellovibrio svalbardensis]
MEHPYDNDSEYYASLPRKRVGSGALIFYRSQILIMQPVYSSEWLLPGGTVEAEESPLEALHREIKEQLNLKIDPLQLIAVDYIPNRDVKGEYLQFLFEVKELTEHQVQQIKISTDYKDFKFVDIEKAISMLTVAAARRLESALLALQDGKSIVYLENGNQPSFNSTMAFL